MIQSTTLANGVRVISHRVEQMHTVSIGIWVANGTRNEPPEHNGIAHFIEHLLFKGTPRRTARQIPREIDSIGGVLNAFTGHEYVCYYAKVLASFLPRAADLLSDIFLNSCFPADEIERERKVVLQEIKMRDDAPEECIHDNYHRNFWRGHPLGQSVLGSEETISALSRQQILDYKLRHYRPEEIIISAAGNVRHEELVSLMEPEFARLPAGNAPAAKGAAFAGNGRRINRIERDLEQVLLCLGTSSLPQDHPDRYPLLLLSTILGGGMSSRLFDEIREKRGLAYAVYSYVISYADSGSLVVYAGTGRHNCREVIGIVLREMGRLKRERVPEDELNSSREQLKGKILMSLESSDNLMTRLAKNEIYLKRDQPIEEVLARFDAVTADDIIRLAETLFDGATLNMELMGPVAGLELDDEQLPF
jgi:predicted Zn-dependent peptidase